MKNKILITGFIALVISLTTMTLTSSAKQAAVAYYDDETKSLQQIMVEYHKYINDSVNASIKTMLTAIDANPVDQNGHALENADACKKHPENFSTFCLAARLLGDGADPANRGFMNYKNALVNRQDKLFDTAGEKDAYSKALETLNCAGLPDAICGNKPNSFLNESEKSQQIQKSYTVQKAAYVSSRMDAINREIPAAKQALDKTLAAYDQLRLAWPMHKQYVNIYKALTTYRDKLAELRSQTDTFPSRFIDVTTTKCT